MKRVCLLLKVKADLVAEYLRTHQVWPQMREAISDAGIKNYSLFIRKDGQVVGYFEAENPQESLATLGQTDINIQWQEKMAEFFGCGTGDMDMGNLEWLDQYFYLE